MTSAVRELLAPRADVWAFLAEPYHLSDWWPGMLGVEPDRRGFAPGARWKVRVHTHNVLLGRRDRETLLLVHEVDLLERWRWQLLSPQLEVELRLRATEPDRTLVTCEVTGGRRRRLAADALERLYGLVQTAAGA